MDNLRFPPGNYPVLPSGNAPASERNIFELQQAMEQLDKQLTAAYRHKPGERVDVPAIERIEEAIEAIKRQITATKKSAAENHW